MRLKYDPNAVTIDLTVACNQACGFCWRHDVNAVRRATRAAPHRDMPLNMFRRIVDQAAKVQSIVGLSVSGPMGEPTLVDDLAERAAYARSKGTFSRFVLMNTNGYALQRHHLRDLVLGFTRIRISLDTMNPEIHAAIHGRRNQHAAIVEGIKALASANRAWKAGCQIEVRVTETREHPGQVEAVRRAFDGIAQVLHRRVHSFIDVVDGLDESGARRCNQPHGTVNFAHTGELTTCCINYRQAPTFGHIDDGLSLKEMWEGEAFERWRAERLEGLCKGCSGLGPQSQKIAEAA